MDERGLLILQASVIVADGEVDEVENDEADGDDRDSRTEVSVVGGALPVVHAHRMPENVKTIEVCQSCEYGGGSIL